MTGLVVREEDVLRLVDEFLQNRELFISQITLERETGVINGHYSDDLLFLRQLILDGQWDDVLEFVSPLATLPAFQYDKFKFLILKAKFVELICIRTESAEAEESAVEAVVEVVKELESFAPSKEVYSDLCLLLTTNKLSDHPQYRFWNPSKGRMTCFNEVLPLIENLLPKSTPSTSGNGPSKHGSVGSGDDDDDNVRSGLVAVNDRLMQLLMKGILYESCVDFCQQKAFGGATSDVVQYTHLLSKTGFNDADLSLLSWLQSLPTEVFSSPFQQRSLNIDVRRLQPQALESTWTEHMMITPIKPSNVFPHSAMPQKKKDFNMTRSLNIGANADGQSLADMSKSLAGFHLSSANQQSSAAQIMQESTMDQLFKDQDMSSSGNQLEVPNRQKPMSVNINNNNAKPSAQNVSQAPGNLQSRPVPPPPQQQAFSDTENKAVVGPRGGPSTPRFVPISSLEDVQAIRCAEFHPGGKVYAVGSNSKTLRICQYPKCNDPTLFQSPTVPASNVLFKRTKHHKGSIYCLAWSPQGDLLATGSNDKCIKLMKYNADTGGLETPETEVNIHDGTIRDCLFMDDAISNALLISGGAGDCRIHVTDCQNLSAFNVRQSFAGHTGHVLSLCTWGGSVFASGSQDKTVRFWDLRARTGCVSMIQYGSSAVASCAVDPSGRLLVTGHEDASCVLYDIRGGRIVQLFRPHMAEIRSVQFSPNALYLLTAGYDNKVALTDLQGDLTAPLPSVVIATHSDKVISGRWHPKDFSFLTTSADKSATLWSLPPL